MNKTLWMCWFQGADKVTGLNKKCIDQWRLLNPGWDVKMLDDTSIDAYAPEYWQIVKKSPGRLSPARSDLLRLMLLSKHGGVWVDASLYPVVALDEYIHELVTPTGFFSYRFMPRSHSAIGARETVSWFLAVDSPGNHLIDTWKDKFTESFIHKREWLHYTVHQDLCDLYDTDLIIHNMIEGMPQIDEKIPHSALLNWNNRDKSSYMYKRPALNL